MSGDGPEREAREWIEAIVGTPLEGSFADALKDGAVLCRLVIAIYAKAGKPLTLKINEPAAFKPMTMASKKMENITNAIKAIRALGMKEFEMFSTLDLYEEKNLQAVRVRVCAQPIAARATFATPTPQVVRCIHALGRLMQSAAYVSLDLPRLGVKVGSAGIADASCLFKSLAGLQVVEKNERSFTVEQLAQARGAVSLLSLGSSTMAKQVTQRCGARVQQMGIQ